MILLTIFATDAKGGVVAEGGAPASASLHRSQARDAVSDADGVIKFAF
jgi:hypothetical protein